MKIYNLLLMLFLSLCSNQIQAQEDEVYLLAGSLYDSEQNRIVRNKIIHVRGAKVVEVGEKIRIPETARVIDLKDHIVLPGLIDAHTHVLFDQELEDDFSEHSINTLVLETEALRTLRGVRRAQSYLDVGITSIKDLGNSGPFLDVALRDAINEGSITGPRIFAAGQIISSAGGQIYGVTPPHQDLIGEEYRVIKSVDDAINAIREHLNQGVDLIKISADNLPNNTRLTPAEMSAIVKTAHDYNLTVTAHSVSNKSAWEAVQAGVDGIEHGFFIADSTLNLMAERKVYLVPTENSLDYMNAHYRPEGSDPEEYAWIDKYVDRMEERLRKAIKSGVTIIAGSDNYTNIGVPRGNSSKDMFKAYFDAGMKPLNILQSATYLSAKAFNKEDQIGVIKPGSYADIIAVKGNLEDDFVESLNNVLFVMKNGKVYLQETN